MRDRRSCASPRARTWSSPRRPGAWSPDTWRPVPRGGPAACHTARLSPPGPRETGNDRIVGRADPALQHPIVTFRLPFGVEAKWTICDDRPVTTPAQPFRDIRACVLGSVNVDLFRDRERLPDPGETVLGRGTRLAIGGKGANQAVAMSRLGASVALVGAVGEDDDGKTATAAVAAAGVEHGGVRRVAGKPTGLAAITVDSGGENTIVVTSGANEACTPAVVREEPWQIEQAALIVAQLELPIDTVLEAFGIADEGRTLRVLNAAPARDVPDGLFRLTDVLVVNAVEAAGLSGVRDDPETAARELLQRGP